MFQIHLVRKTEKLILPKLLISKVLINILVYAIIKELLKVFRIKDLMDESYRRM